MIDVTTPDQPKHRIAAPVARLVPVAVFLVAVVLADFAGAQTQRPGDRFGVRGGIWPHKAIAGSLGERGYSPNNPDYRFDARIDEDATIAPFVEVYALFHLRGRLWAEASVGWSGRADIQVSGVNATDKILLGNGRVDFFPLFGGVRYSRQFGSAGHPHNVYARAGGSLVFANESPDLVQDSVNAYGIYSPGTEGAFGFLAGGGSEIYVTPTFGLLLDVNYRYTRFSYGRDAKFNLSNVWLGIGATIRTH